MLEATGRCQTLLGATFYCVRVEGSRVRAVEAWFSGTSLLVEADVFIDCTADGDVCAAAGCEYYMGEDPKSRYGEPTAPEKAGMHLNGLTLCYRITDTGVKQKPYLPKDVPEGICPKPVHIVVLPNGDHLLNAVGMIDGNAILWTDYARLMREGHRRVLEHFFWLQRLAPDDRSPWTPPRARQRVRYLVDRGSPPRGSACERRGESLATTCLPSTIAAQGSPARNTGTSSR